MRTCYYCFLSSILLFVILIPAAQGQELVINEVLAANVWGISDENGDNPDWFELYNNSGSAINLSGYGITDNPDEPYRWIFPSVTIQSGGYLKVFASGKDRTSPNLHTNFKIKSSGEDLVLTDPSGTTVDQIETGYIPSDISRGRQPNGTGDFYYFATPTPGTANNSTGCLEIAEAPTFSAPAGFISGSISLSMTAPSTEAVIRYTLDGSPPTESSTEYTSPISINGTTVVRARAFVTDYLFSDITTCSYIDYDNHDLAVVSLSSHPDNFFSYSIGIYVNYNQDWERPVHVEFFEPDGTLAFQNESGVKTVGGHTLSMNAQKSLALFARDKYNCEKFDYQIFSDREIDEFKTFVLRNSGNDWSKTMMRDALMQGLVDDCGIDNQAYRPTIVFINGDYYGIHNLREKENEDYLASYYDVDPDSVDILEMNCEVVEGSASDYNAMIDYLEANSLQSDENYQYIQTQMDVDEFMIYEAAQIYYANSDWPGNNIKFWRPQRDDGMWRWLMYDLDAGFGLWESYTHNTLSWATSPYGGGMFNPPWSTFLLRSLLENDDFTDDFINCFADLMNFEFDPDLVNAMIDEMSAVIEPEMSAHLSRWNQGPISGWYNDLDDLYEFSEHRPAYMQEDIVSYFSIPGTADITLNAEPADAGRIQINTKLIEEFPWSGTYFISVPIPLTATAHAGYHFAGWSGATLPDTNAVSLVATGNTSITALFEADSVSSETTVINEFMALNESTVADQDGEYDDWIELYNNGSADFDLNGYCLSDDAANLPKWTFPDTLIPAYGYLIVWADEDEDQEGLHANFKLSASGEEIYLVDSTGTIVDEIIFTEQTADISLGRYPNGTGSFVAMPPTFGYENEEGISNTSDNPLTLPTTFTLEQNYPNPFNATTTIAFSLPQATPVKLTVYNIYGQVVATLINENRPAGIHQVSFDAKELPSGLYIYRLNTINNTATGRMVLLK